MVNPSPVASIPYPIFVGRDLLDRVGELAKTRGKVFVITSATLRVPFGERVAKSFSPAAEIITALEGEANKSLATAGAIIDALVAKGARRDSAAVVVGGGMLGDTAGFAASIFMRGIDLVHVPTTLLAMVDSSIGGKVAVNHPKGKNLIGSFHRPSAVIADPSVLRSLTKRELLSGLFEAVKGGVIRDRDLFALFETRRDAMLALDPPVIDEIVQRKIRVKADIVSADEREGGLRRLLNYGHTIGHALEAATKYAVLTHGEAVAWGMIAANAVAVRRRLLSEDAASRIDRTIRSFDPPPLPHLDPAGIVRATEVDKKNRGNARVMVLPTNIGEAVVVEDVTDDEIAYGVRSICRS